MTGHADICFDSEDFVGGHPVPFGNRAASNAQGIRQFGERSARPLSDDIQLAHGACLQQVSTPCKPQMLTHGQPPLAHNVRMAIGDLIKAARVQAGLSQRAFAEAVGVTRGAVGAWESHRTSPSRAHVRKIATVTGKAVDWFLPPDKPVTEAPTPKTPDEVELLLLWRQLSRKQQIGHLNLFRTSVDLRAEIEQESHPTQVENIDAP